MISRYNMSQIKQIWNFKNIYQTWWLVEKIVILAWNQIGVIDDDVCDFFKKKTFEFDVEKIAQYELQTNHDVVAFVNYVSDQCDEKYRRWIHYGLTSTDIRDTAQNLLIKQSHDVVVSLIKPLLKILKTKALKYKALVCLGRTHGMAAEPTSFGLKFLLIYEELKRGYCYSQKMIEALNMVKISGSVGNFAHLDPRIEQIVADKLKMHPDRINTQVTQRSYYSQYFMTLKWIVNALHKLALEIRHLHRTGIEEVSEGFDLKSQIGSSSMPHKKNPIASEKICGLSLLVYQEVDIFLHNNLLWHERDISHSSNERIIIPDLFHIVCYLLQTTAKLINTLQVNKQQITQNLSSSRRIYYSQLIMNYLILHNQGNRQTVYQLIKNASQLCLTKKIDFVQALRDINQTLQLDFNVIEQLCEDDQVFLKNIDVIYDKVLNCKY